MFDLELGFKVTQNVVQYLLNHVTYVAAKFAVVTSNGLGATFTRNMTDRRTLVHNEYTLFSKEKRRV